MKRWLIRLLPWVVTLLLIRFLVMQGGDVRALVAELRQVQWPWLVLAILFQAATYSAIAWLNELLLRAYGVMVPRFRQFLIQYAMAFAETVIPSVAVSGMLLRVHLLRPYGATPDVAVVTNLMETAAIALSVAAPALLVGIIVLAGGSSDGQILLWSAVASFTVGVGSLLVVYRWRRGRLRQATSWTGQRLAVLWDESVVRRWPQRFSAWPSSRISGRLRFLWAELLPLLRRRPHLLASALILRAAFEATAFAACFYAFGVDLPLLTLLLLYTLTITVNTLGAVPGGVGLAEVSLASIYLQLGIPPETAVAVALTYRITGYWLPRVVGGLGWLWLEYIHRTEAMPQGAT